MNERNPSWFKKGDDLRPHILPLTGRQQHRLRTPNFHKKPSRVKSWLWTQIRRYYSARRGQRNT